MYSSFQCRVAGDEAPVAATGSAGSGAVPATTAAASAAGSTTGTTATAGAAGTLGTGDGLPFRRGIRLLETGCVENVLQVGKYEKKTTSTLYIVLRTPGLFSELASAATESIGG